MSRFILSLFVVLASAIGLSSCGVKPKLMTSNNTLYDVRRAVVTANANVPASLISGVQRRVDMAIQSTHRPVDLPRVVMNIHINSVNKGLGLDKGQSEASVVVTLADASEGAAFLQTTMPIYSYTQEPGTANEALAEAIAARLRFNYALKVPPVRKAAYRSPSLSTRMADDPANDGPLVIPSASAKVVGADADPVLNSRTEVTPDQPMAKVEPSMKTEMAPKAIDEGASAAVKIAPKATQSSDEPCVETLDSKCPAN